MTLSDSTLHAPSNRLTVFSSYFAIPGRLPRHETRSTLVSIVALDLSFAKVAELNAEPMTCPALVDAHRALDKAVDAVYGYKGGKDDASRVAFLFETYQQHANPAQLNEKVEQVLQTAPTSKRQRKENNG